MSDAREEAAIARDALVRDKKKPKQQTTLLTKWNMFPPLPWGGEVAAAPTVFCFQL